VLLEHQVAVAQEGLLLELAMLEALEFLVKAIMVVLA
jgi:hypothetical protein